MFQIRSNVLTLAGFDPSAGAGLLADIKTFEAYDIYGCGVCTALTFQNDKEFHAVKWVAIDDITKQIEILMKSFDFKWVKIGLIENIKVLDSIIDCLHINNLNIKIIWDPIIKATAGYEFHPVINISQLESICKKIFLITPNREEIKALLPHLEELKAADYLSDFCAVLLKTEYYNGNMVRDVLVQKRDKEYFESERIKNMTKHGSGCVLSAAVLANLAKGYEIKNACFKAKEYTHKFLISSPGLLGFHTNIT